MPVAQSTPLAAGASACGFYFDLVKGSTAVFTASTVKTPGKRAKPRALHATTLDKDGHTVLIEPSSKAGKGKVSSGKFTAPSTGRFYFVVSSDDGGEQIRSRSSPRSSPTRAARETADPTTWSPRTPSPSRSACSPARP